MLEVQCGLLKVILVINIHRDCKLGYQDARFVEWELLSEITM